MIPKAFRRPRRPKDPGSADPLAAIPDHVRPAVERDLRDADPDDRAIATRALPYTMTGVPRLLALIDAVRYCVRRDIPGAFAECGVWLGGSIIAMLLTLRKMGVTDRDVYLYDTFEGMTEPTQDDRSRHQRPALEEWREAARRKGRWLPQLFGADVFSESRVRANVLATGYPSERLRFVRGPVEETIPDHAPSSLALLRLDTDWYLSTRHELRHLYPRLSPAGVLIIDDYGHWEGCRKAVDEYFSERPRPLLHRIDYAARIAVKA